jgi:hypothetical protein
LYWGVKLKTNIVIKKNHPNHDKIVENFAQIAKGAFVKVGVLQKEGEEVYTDENGKPQGTLVLVASADEFGTDTIPERSYIRSTMDEGAKDFIKKMYGFWSQVMSGTMSVDMALDRTGMFAVGRIINKINSIRTPPNALSTIKAKGSSKPLIEDGRLRQSISYEKGEDK